MQPGGRGATPPNRDMVITEGQPIRLGDETVTPVMTPGHTPGSIALIFPYEMDGQPTSLHCLGGTVLRASNAMPEAQQQYLQSLEHFGEIAKQMKVDVEVQNQPLYDNTFEKAAAWKTRKPSARHPIVVGETNYSRFVDVMTECMKAAIARK